MNLLEEFYTYSMKFHLIDFGPLLIQRWLLKYVFDLYKLLYENNEMICYFDFNI